jgi:DNA replication regulator SLD2
MTDVERADLTEKSNVLRIDLKTWEKEFASAHNGKKASRDDIKANPDIGTLFSNEILIHRLT